jgi:dynein heavy chain
VDDITAVVIILLEGNPKDKSWGAAQKLMNNVDKFLERLRGYKGIIDQGQVRGIHAASCGTATIQRWHQPSRVYALNV